MDEFEEPPKNRFVEKMKEYPFFPIGICGLLFVCGYGAYKFKDRGAMPISIYLMQLRVAAQGTAVGIFAIGLCYSMIRKHVLNIDD